MLMEKIKVFLSILCAFVAVTVSAQNMRVSGTVTDAATGEGIPFASLRVKGTTNGTSTDASGAYTINVPANAVIIFSAIGYVTAEEDVNGKGVVNASLSPDTENLEETVVVAYGTAKKSSFTGSASTVKSESLEKRSVSNVSKAIEGMVAGVQATSGTGQPGDGATIYIRGTGSINADSTPLYVVDGIPYDGAIASINPNDIESLTVLKDASATALYGSRASNGVIMITTKRGSDGKANVNFKATFGFQSRAIKSYDMVNQTEYVELVWEALKNDYMINGGYSEAQSKTLASQGMSSFLGGEHYNPWKNYTWDTLIDPTTGKVQADAVSAWNEDWMDALTDNGALRQEYQLGVTGGNSKTKYAFSFGYLDEDGILITTNFKRYSIRANVDHTVNDWFGLGASASYAYTNQNASNYTSGSYTGNAWYTAQFMAPIYPVYLKDDDGNTVYDDYGNKVYDYGDDYGRPTAAGFNVVADHYDNEYETLRDASSVRAYATFGGDKEVMGILKGLSFTTNFGADIDNRNVSSYYNPYYGDGASTDGDISKYSTRTFSYTWNQILKYEKDISDFHILAQVGHEFYSYNYKYLYAERTGVYPGITELAPATTVTDNSSYSYDYRIESYFARVAADYADKYYLEATWRTDGSSRFHKDYRWGNFWSVGASWRISQENFFKNVSWVDNLTLRLSYGELGNDAVGTFYAWQSFYDLTWANANNAGAVISSLENTSLTWERKGTINVGIEGTLLNHLLEVNFEYYYSKTTDMLLESPMAMSTGFTGYDANVGSMRNSGFEGTVRVNWLKKGDFRASSTIMGYFNKNKVLHLNGESDTITSGNYVIKEGMPIYTFYLAKVAGVDPANGQLLYWAYESDDDGNMIEGTEYITSSTTEATASKYYLGSREPDLQGSFGTDFAWKNLDFSFLTTFSIGGKVYDSLYGSSMEVSYAGKNFHKNALRRWQQPGDVTDVPVFLLGSSNLAADRWLIDASYFAIKSIQLGYTLPKKWTNAVNISSVRVFGMADNLCLFSHLNGLNPQYNMTGGTGYVYTPTRVISFGVDINF